ncbi:hypothetical protein GGI06_001278 [Coemansia sp. S85]|nr:hypothetical protein GGI06_001278 [Coemansia sp. S85]
MAWSFVSDCMKLPLCLVHSPKSISCASVSLASRVSSAELRGGLVDDSWLDRVGADRGAVADVAQWLLEFYAREAQSRMTRGVADGAAEAAQTPISSPGSAASPMSHVQPSPLSELK